MSKHLARIGKVDKIQEIVGADKIQTAIIYGFEVIVSKNVKENDIGIFFEASDTQLSPEYCKNNNLYRHSELNLDTTKAGYLEDNGKLKVQKFMKVKSEGLFMPFDSLDFTKGDYSNLKNGDSFEEFNGVKICQKFFNARTESLKAGRVKAVKKIETPLFHEHVDTEQLAYYIKSIPEGSLITISHKQHGTSHRVSYTKLIREVPDNKRNFFVKYWNKFLPKYRFSKRESCDEYIAGSRRVVLMPEDTEKESFHGKESWRFDILEQFKPYLEKNMTVYMEVVGYVNNSPIMGTHDISKLKDSKFTKKYGTNIVYKYGCMEGEYKVYVYRISLTNPEGIEIDYSPKQLADWCEKRNFLYAKPLVSPFLYDGDDEKLMSLVKNIAERDELLCEDYSDPSHINEGVVIRVDNTKLIPSFFKYKTFPFKLMEGIIKQSEDFVDLEDAS